MCIGVCNFTSCIDARSDSKSSLSNEDNQISDLESYVGDYKESFENNSIDIRIQDSSCEQQIEKSAIWKFNVKSRQFTSNIMKDCNKVIGEVQTFFDSHPDSFLIKDKYEVVLLFSLPLPNSYISVSNTYPFTQQVQNKFQHLHVENDYNSYYLNYLDTITTITGDVDIKYLEPIRKMKSLKVLYVEFMDNDKLDYCLNYLHNELPDIEIVNAYKQKS